MKDENTPAAATPLTRRVVFAGAGTVGALAAVAAVMPRLHAPQPASPVASAAPADAASGDGYQLTEHVKRYYETARV